MITKEEMDKIVLKEKETRLNISRIPLNVKNEFTEYAKEEFCDDFGLCFKSVWDNFKMWKLYFENMSMKLDLILNEINNFSNKEKEEKSSDDKKSIRFLSGRKVEGGNE